jgi:hypothetical protein
MFAARSVELTGSFRVSAQPTTAFEPFSPLGEGCGFEDAAAAGVDQPASFGRNRAERWLVRRKTVNTYLLVAAGISAVGGVLHSILGERLILSRLGTAGLPETLGSSAFTLRVLRLFWHLVSVAWWGFTALLVLLASMPASKVDERLIWAIALTFLASAVVSFTVSRGKHFSWGVLLIIAVLTWLGGG